MNVGDPSLPAGSQEMGPMTYRCRAALAERSHTPLEPVSLVTTPQASGDLQGTDPTAEVTDLGSPGDDIPVRTQACSSLSIQGTFTMSSTA